MTAPVDPLRPSDLLTTADGRASNLFVRQWNNLVNLVFSVRDALATALAAQVTADAALPKALTNTHVFVGNASNIAADVEVSGDVTITNAGAVTIGANKVQESKLDLADNTTFNSSTSKHGFLKKLDNSAAHFMDGQGNWSTPAGTATPVTVKDEGSNITTALASLNFVGGGVTATNSSDNVTVTIPGGSGVSAALSAAILANSPTGYWKCDEAAGTSFADSSGNGFNLTTLTSIALAQSALLPNESTKYAFFGSTTGQALLSGSVLGLTAPLTSDWSVEAIIRQETGATLSGIPIFCIGGGNSASENRNLQAKFAFHSGNDLISAQWEQGAGSTLVATGPSDPSAKWTNVSQLGRAIHWCITKDATNKRIRVYRNGVLVRGGTQVSGDTYSTYVNEPTGGTDTANMQVTIGNDSVQNLTNTVIGHVAFFYGTRLSDAQVYAHAAAAGLTRD